MNDLISRQQAIDALKQMQKDISGDFTELDPLVMAGCGYIGDCVGVLEILPSAHPEQEVFEWCRDCKEYDQAKHCCHRWTKTIRKTVDELKQSAQQGTWQQRYITTPTGGQHCVWECDGCGARVAERTKYCADCGRRMTE